MGFSTLAAATTATASMVPRLMEAHAYKKESKNLLRAADTQEHLANEQANAITKTALRNARAENKNANAELSRAFADAGASNLSEDGSVAVRESDLATRLQDEINLHTDTALREANTTRAQGAYDAWNTRNAAMRAKRMARSSIISGLGSLVGNLGSSLGGSGSSGGRA